MSLSLRVRRMGGPASGVASARQSYAERHGLLLELREGERLLGVGEASPLLGFGDDDLDKTAAALHALQPPSALPSSVAEIWHWSSSQTLTPSARFAVETALLDALGRAQSVSVALLLGSTLAAVPRSCLAGRLGDDDCLARARDAKQRGAARVKLKATADLGSEAQRLSDLIGELPGLEIHLDFNGTLTPREVAPVLDRYAALGVTTVEEPVSGRALLELGETPLPWFVDESLHDPDLGEPLIRAAHGVVLKPTVLGGLKRCLDLALAARKEKKPVVISHTFEGPVALAACCELALAVQADSAGLDRHAGLGAFGAAVVEQLPHAAATGQRLSVIPSARAGLGLELDAWTP